MAQKERTLSMNEGRVKYMDMEQLREMKRQMATRGNWKEVKRINKMIEFHAISI